MQQRIKVNNAYSTYPYILYGVPQVFTLSPLLFNIYISDMFYDIENCDIDKAMLATTHHTPVALT